MNDQKNKSASKSPNSSEDEKDYLEKQFLDNCNIEDLPLPIKELNDYYKNVLVFEVMKSGCNRQIAEYVIFKYQKLEEKDVEKLYDLKANYDKIKPTIFNIIKKEVKENIGKNIQISEEDQNIDLTIFEDEIEELSKDIQKEKEELKNKSEDVENCIKFSLIQIMKNKDKNKDNKNFVDSKEKFYEKNEAVIEAALRKIKKIVNDDEEYKAFQDEYKVIINKQKEKNKENNKDKK